jgi:hypothetical protein
MSGRVSDAERSAILTDLQAGRSIHATAAARGRSKDTVARLARDAGVPLAPPPEYAMAARVARAEAAADFNSAARLDAINGAVDVTMRRLMEMDPASPFFVPAHHLQGVTTALAILIDKRRLEEGQASSRTESVSLSLDRMAQIRAMAHEDRMAVVANTEGALLAANAEGLEDEPTE